VNAIVLIPAYNEEANIGEVIADVLQRTPPYDVLVVNDGSSDGTAGAARQAGAKVLDLPCNLGVGGAIQAGFRYAVENGYEYAIRCDGDGQHPATGIQVLVDAMQTNETDLVVGSRFRANGSYKSAAVRHAGIFVLGCFLSLICRKRVTDPTSGFQMINRPLMAFWAQSYPMDYPEPEAIALMRRQGYSYVEVPTEFRERLSGRSSIGGWDTLYYVFKVLLALVVDRARPIDPQYQRENVLQRLCVDPTSKS
jgi:glycosyltransferase involved in cell wall biosynthesis